MIQGLNGDVPAKILTFNRTSAYVLKDIFLKLRTLTKVDDWALKVGWEGSKPLEVTSIMNAPKAELTAYLILCKQGIALM